MKKLLFFLTVSLFVNFSNAQCTGFTLSNIDLDFGDETTFPIPSGDIANGGNLSPAPLSFDIWDETTGNVGSGGVDDITLTISMSSTFDPYGGTVEGTTSTTHDVIQDGTGIKGRLAMGTSGATDATTGDVRCYTIDVDFASHVDVRAADITDLVTSVNTAGEAFESAVVIFKDEALVPYGTATYTGFFSSPPTGVPGGSNPSTTAASAWTSTGTGVYFADETVTVDLTDPFNPVAGTNGADNIDPNAATEGGLGNVLVGGFTYTVCLEDVAATLNDGDITTSSTNFSSTLNGISLASICLGTFSLPVELIHFSARKTNKNEVTLSWATASEENSDYYEIEYSTDSKNFSKIGRVSAAGNSAEEINYSFIHSNPLSQNNYYRLKQVDIDGTYAYSDIEIVRSNQNPITIYPTLTDGKLSIASNDNTNQQNISIMNLSGQCLYKSVMTEGEILKDLDVSFLSPGQYIIIFSNRNDVITHQFIKR